MSALDNQIFRKFDTMLESRLCDYFTSDIADGEPGSVENPLQLANNDPHRMGRPQNGILFRVSPAYTLMDPETGFVSLFDLSRLKNAEMRAKFLARFDSIRWDPDINLFVARFNYKNFDIKIPEDRGAKDLAHTEWTIYIGKPRTDYDRTAKVNVYNERPWLKVVGMLENEGLLERDLAKEDLGKILTNQLYDLFEQALKGQVVRACEENPVEYFTSPAVIKDSGMGPTEVRAYNLARKLWYTVTREDTKGNYTVDWLNSVA
jgi:CRISPR-associated protein Cpf1